MDDAPALEGEVLDFLEREGALLIPAPEQPPTVRLLPMRERRFSPAQTLSQLMNEGPWLQTVEATRAHAASRGFKLTASGVKS